MRNDKRRISETAGNATQKRSRVPPKEKLAPSATHSQDPIRTAIGTIFRNDESVREAITTNLKERSAASKAIADRARTAFSSFNPSKYSSAERDRPNYLAPGDDLAGALTTVIKKGVHAIRNSSVNRSIKLQDRPELRNLIKEKKGGNDTHVGTIDLKDLMDYIRPNPGALQHRPPLQQRSPNDPTFTSCEAELEAEKRITNIQESTDTKPTADGSKPDESSSQGDSRSADETSDTQHVTTAKLVKDNVNLQMETATSPEDKLRYDIRPSRSNQNDIRDGIGTFELRSGPSDVTSYHDFNSLQIAFEHVWIEIFDGRLASLGRQLYEEYVKLKDFNGLDDKHDLQISTLDDLKKLMDEIRDLSRLTVDSVPSELGPEANGSGGPKQDVIGDAAEKAKKVLEAAIELAFPGATLLAAIANGLLGQKKVLTWDSFKGNPPAPLSDGDVISVSIEPKCREIADQTTVEIVLKVKATTNLDFGKGLEFTDNAGNKFAVEIQKADEKSATIPLYGIQMKDGMLEFRKGKLLNYLTGMYVMGGFNIIEPGTRVTFTWIKD